MTLPVGFENYFRSVWSAEDVDRLIRGLGEEVPVSIRLNPARLPDDAWPEGGEARVPWCHEGIYLRERPQFTADPLLHAGAYYVQEASSMFIAHVLRTLISPPSTVNSQLSTLNCQLSTVNCQLSTLLDLCAAPGGKSTLLRSLLPPECWLVSNEPVRQRAQVLAENMAKWGAENTVVTSAYAKDIARAARRAKGFAGFDLILADVPCSGEGMMRKEEAAVRQWSPQFIADCAALQCSIVEDIWPALRPGGFLVYSTCTFNPEEDEQNVEWIARELGADIIPIPVDPAWGILGDMRKVKPGQPTPGCGLHFIPGLVRGEGFFCALLQKHGQADGSSDRDLSFRHADGRSSAASARLIASLTENLTVLPTDLLDDASAPRVDLSLADAVRYLQREALTLPPDAPRGIVQLCYRGQRLGLAKNIGSRANNLYPKEWRIRSSHLEPHSILKG